VSNNKNSMKSGLQQVNLKRLYLDPNNFRLIHETDYVPVNEDKIKEKNVAQRTYRILTGDKNQEIMDLVESFKSNGYLPGDAIQVRSLPGGDFVVIEGNRRVAALKYLQKESEEKAIDLGRLDACIFDNVPVVLYEDTDEIHHMTLMALKHISGNKKWGEWNQAKLLEKMYNSYKISEEEIVKRIGITKHEFRRSLRALSLLEQYKSSDWGDQFNQTKFPIFREVARNSNLKEWLDWDDDSYLAQNRRNRELFFSWISKIPKEEEGEDGEVAFGDGFLEPAINKRDDVVLLGKIIHDEKALANMIEFRDLNAAYRSGNLIFKERQEAAVKSLYNELETLSRLVIDSSLLPDLEKAYGRIKSIIDRTRVSRFGGVEQKSVFHDRIDAHFSEFNIHRYRRLENLHIKNLSRINLFAGINNSGKTSLLEALYLLCRQTDFDGVLEVVRRRGKLAEDQLTPDWFIMNIPEEINISGVFDRTETKVSYTHFEENNEYVDRSRYLGSIDIEAKYGEIRQDSITHIFSEGRRETQSKGTKILCPSIFSSPFFLNEPIHYTRFYYKSTQSKVLGKILDFIRRKVLKSLSDIRLVDEKQRFLVDDQDFPNAMDLTQYGEGLQRIFFISLLFASAQNGVILIDEFENAIHTDLVAEFAGSIYELAVLFNTQVFLTSHSKECIDSFIRHIPKADDLVACALVSENGKIKAREFPGQKFKELLLAGNVDLRRAK